MSGGPIEVVTRIRCAACGTAIERQNIAHVDRFPCVLKLEIGTPLPPGFVAVDGQIYCTQHEPKRVVPVAVMPAGPVRVARG